jgi:thiamine-monophosphate kinase
MALGEFDLIEKYFRPPVRRAALGGGDDCAADAHARHAAGDLDRPAGRGAAFPVHRRAGAAGHKALAVNLSDLAACGAEPLAFTLALSLPRADAAFLAPFAEGLRAGRAAWSN